MSKNNWPRNFVCGPFNYKIEYGEAKLSEYRRAGDQDNLGLTLTDRKIMYIGDDRPIEAIKDTVNHEVCHAVIHTYSIIVPHYDDDASGKEDYDKEERFVSAFCTAYMDTMLRNPKLSGWLFSRE